MRARRTRRRPRRHFDETWGDRVRASRRGGAARRARTARAARTLARLSARRANGARATRLDDARSRASTSRARSKHESSRAMRRGALEAAERADGATGPRSAAGRRAPRSSARDADEASREGGRRAVARPARAEALARALEELSGRGRSGDHRRSRGRPRIVPRPHRDRHGLRAGRGVGRGRVGRRHGRRRTTVARAALEALRREGGAGLILPVAERRRRRSPLRRRGLRALRAALASTAQCARARDASARRAVRRALHRQRLGVRHGGRARESRISPSSRARVTDSPRRAGASRRDAPSSRARAVEESQTAAREATRARRRPCVSDARAPTRRLIERSPTARTAPTSRVGCGRSRRVERLDGEVVAERLERSTRRRPSETLTDDLGELTEQIVTNDEELLALREQLPISKRRRAAPANARRASPRRARATGRARRRGRRGVDAAVTA